MAATLLGLDAVGDTKGCGEGEGEGLAIWGVDYVLYRVYGSRAEHITFIIVRSGGDASEGHIHISKCAINTCPLPTE